MRAKRKQISVEASLTYAIFRGQALAFNGFGIGPGFEHIRRREPISNFGMDIVLHGDNSAARIIFHDKPAFFAKMVVYLSLDKYPQHKNTACLLPSRKAEKPRKIMLGRTPPV